jgi:hypothetical protein
MPSPHRITVYLPPEKLEELRQKAEKQRRSASNLAAALILESLENPSSYAEAITLLKALASGESPTDANVILAAHELDIDPDTLFQIRDRLFKKGKQTNGT